MLFNTFSMCLVSVMSDDEVEGRFLVFDGDDFGLDDVCAGPSRSLGIWKRIDRD